MNYLMLILFCLSLFNSTAPLVLLHIAGNT